MGSRRLQPPPVVMDGVNPETGPRHSLETQPVETTKSQPTALLRVSGERPRSKSLLSPTANGGRKRAGSGNFMSRLSFFRAGLSENHAANTKEAVKSPPSPSPPAPDHSPTEDTKEPEKQKQEAFTKRGGSALAHALEAQQHKGRKRKGSLRKTALLGTGMLRRSSNAPASAPENGVAADSNAKEEQQQQQQQQQQAPPQTQKASTSPPKKNDSKNRFAQLQTPIYPSIASRTGGPSTSLTSLSTVSSSATSTGAAANAGSATSPTGGAYASTTTSDEDLTASNDGSGSINGNSRSGLSLRIPPKHSHIIPVFSTSASPAALLRRTSIPQSPPSSTSDSPIAATTATSSPVQHRVRSPLSINADTSASTAAAAATAVDEGWDYSETAWWGWVVLIVTWIVFVVGMGSCLEVWSWAWDVGQTPYAPPELENDPTLPIVGYYPALMVLTGVMSWVWVVVAWVGMKYFRHAKIQTDDDT